MDATAETCIGETRIAVRREMNAARLNTLVNHPHVRPTCGGDGQSFIDLSDFVADQRNHALAWVDGAFLFQWSAPQTYEVHIMVLPQGRGRRAYRMARRGIAYMVSEGAERLWARIARDAGGLRHYTAQAGFTQCGTDILDIGHGPVIYDLYQWKKPCLQQ